MTSEFLKSGQTEGSQRIENVPIFPNLKVIDIEDKPLIDRLTRQFLPYNDHEFLSLWTYNKDGQNAYSTLNGNLVIRIHDFITGKLFYSFIGTQRVDNTIQLLLMKSEKEGLKKELRLVPEICIQSSLDTQNNFAVFEDRDSADYILLREDVAELEGGKFREQRKRINKFLRDFPNYRVEKVDLSSSVVQKQIEDMFVLWESRKGKTRDETEIELTAIRRLFFLASTFPIECLMAQIEERVIGFCTYHVVQHGFAIFSFAKGDTSYKAIYDLMNQEAAKRLKNYGVNYINYEQDLGIPGLREAKLLWKPKFFLKKYTIRELN